MAATQEEKKVKKLYIIRRRFHVPEELLATGVPAEAVKAWLKACKECGPRCGMKAAKKVIRTKLAREVFGILGLFYSVTDFLEAYELHTCKVVSREWRRGVGLIIAMRIRVCPHGCWKDGVRLCWNCQLLEEYAETPVHQTGEQFLSYYCK